MNSASSPSPSRDVTWIRLIPLQFAWLVGLGLYFFTTYNAANWFSSQRLSVPEIVFGWERYIPFLAWTIIPYWSTDLVYALSILCCRSRQELALHGKRLLTLQTLSVIAFLLFPLRCVCPRPEADGIYERLFVALASFDQPFNQAPSLHLGITTVMWTRFRHPALRLWFVLMGVSTLTTFQHHFIDLPTGIWAGLFSMALFPQVGPRHPRLAACYLLGSGLLSAIAFSVQSLAWVLLWPAYALSMVAAAYWTGNPNTIGKRNPLFAAYIAGAWLNSRLWTRKHPEPSEIADGVWLGRAPFPSERQQFCSLVDVTAELNINPDGVVYHSVPMLDLTKPTPDQLQKAVEAIEATSPHRPTLVCCALGYSRSAAAVQAWLVRTGRATTLEAARELIQQRRPQTRL